MVAPPSVFGIPTSSVFGIPSPSIFGRGTPSAFGRGVSPILRRYSALRWGLLASSPGRRHRSVRPEAQRAERALRTVFGLRCVRRQIVWIEGKARSPSLLAYQARQTNTSLAALVGHSCSHAQDCALKLMAWHPRRAIARRWQPAPIGMLPSGLQAENDSGDRDRRSG